MTTVSTAGGPALRHRLGWSARVAQSLADRTGLWLEYQQRTTDGDAVPAVIWTPPTFYDDGVYDDPYVIDGPELRAGVGHIFARGSQLDIFLGRSERELTARAVGDRARSDVLIRATVDVRLPVWSFDAADFDVVAGYRFVENRSTDPLQAYRSHGVAAGIRAGF